MYALVKFAVDSSFTSSGSPVFNLLMLPDFFGDLVHVSGMPPLSRSGIIDRT